jgi:hypothetical protein
VYQALPTFGIFEIAHCSILEVGREAMLITLFVTESVAINGRESLSPEKLSFDLKIAFCLLAFLLLFFHKLL